MPRPTALTLLVLEDEVGAGAVLEERGRRSRRPAESASSSSFRASAASISVAPPGENGAFMAGLALTLYLRSHLNLLPSPCQALFAGATP